MQKISPFLWFDTQAEEAVTFYLSIFPNSRIEQITRYGESGPGPKGSVMTISFDLNGQHFVALNGGPHYKFNEAVSFVVNCADQAEVDRMWERLTDGGQPGQCGWLKDRFGLSWQIVPAGFVDALTNAEPAKAGRGMAAMMQMSKLDIDALRKAQAG